MDDKKRNLKPFFDALKGELKAHSISYEQLALETAAQKLNAGKGYPLQKIADIMSGRISAQADILQLCVEMVEAAMRTREKVAAGDPAPLIARLEMACTRRGQLEKTWAA